MKSFQIIKSETWPGYDVKITLKPCFRCNQQCWFCNEYDNNTKMWTLEDCDKVLNKLEQLPDRFANVFIYFYGGEPTLSKHWEYLHYRLFDILSNRKVFFQTQTNLSIKNTRLSKFLTACDKLKSESHTVDICNSYHVGKQDVKDYISNMKTCDEHDALGYCFFSTEIPKEDQVVREMREIIQHFPDKLKLKFTVIPKLKQKQLQGYEHVTSDPEMMSDDNGQYAEYRYFTSKYPFMLDHLEESWNFDVDGEILNYVDVKHRRLHEKFRLMSCECGRRGVVIDHNLKVYHCNDDNYNNINSTDLNDLDLTSYLSRNSICMNQACWDGLDFNKSSITQ